MRTLHIPELLAPAGNQEKLETALAYGASAVYMGGPGLNLRAPGAGFGWDELDAGVALAHLRGARAYVCLNALPPQSRMAQAREALERVGDFQGQSRPDGLIIADPGVLSLALQTLPDIPIHLSTQANTANAQAAAFWRDVGVARVNIARELSVGEIRALRRACPDVEIEAFVHGAMCMAVSGRCVMSAYLNDRSANLGRCTHPCRFDYKVTGLRLEEAQRPGTDTWEVVEGDGFSSILAAEDLCLIRFTPWFARQGVDAIKIEGRMKSGGYLAHAVDAYATAIADFKSGQFRPQAYLDELRNTASRDLTTGMFLPGGRRVNYGRSEVQQPIVGRVIHRLGPDSWAVAARAKWRATDTVCVMCPGLHRPLLKGAEYALEKADGTRLDEINSGQDVVLRCDSDALAPHLYLRAAS